MNTNGGRDACIRFVEGYWVVMLKQFDPAKIEKFGDDIVTALVWKTAKSLDDVIKYVESAGYSLWATDPARAKLFFWGYAACAAGI